MTREEAINVIKGARQYLTVGNPIWNVKKVDEAMKMAIEALQREEAEEKGYCHRIFPSNVEVVVRCKDCRHSNKSMLCSVYLQPRLPSDFCNYGERKEE